MNEESKRMQELAREIYQENKKVMDFIMEHGSSDEFQYAAEQLIGKKEGDGEGVRIFSATNSDVKYRYFRLFKRRCSFLPEKWVQALGEDSQFHWEGCEKWWAGYPLICFFRLKSNSDDEGAKLKLHVLVGPLKDLDLRNQLIHHIKEQGQLCNPKKISFQKNPGSKYSAFLSASVSTVKIDNSQESDEINKGFQTLLNRFEEIIEPVEIAIKEWKEKAVK